MRMRRAGVAAFARGLTLFGCSLLTSLDGLSGAPVPDATAEAAAAESGTSNTPEAGGDADGDGSLVPGEGGEAGPIDPCIGATFCDHFERADVQGSWNSVYTDNGGTAAISTTTFTSATRSLALHVPSSLHASGQAGGRRARVGRGQCRLLQLPGGERISITILP